MMTEVPHSQCSRCHCHRSLDLFLNDKGRRLKTCKNCRDKFKCSYDNCSYSSSENKTLVRHINMVHLKIKDKVCPFKQCEFKCTMDYDLKRHIKTIHLDIRDVKCPHDCDYKCSYNSDLQKHIKAIHLKIKDNVCPNNHCDYKSSTKWSLTSHLKTCGIKHIDSHGDLSIKNTLSDMGVKYEYNSIHIPLKERFDFIIKTDNEPLFIEYDGKQHFDNNNTDIITQDKLKDDFCSDNGFLIKRISYKQFENIHSIVVGFIRDNTDWGYE